MNILGKFAKKIGADSAAIMVPNIKEKHLYCYASFNMPKEWISIKNSFDEKVPGGNVEVYKSNKPAVTNQLQKTLKGYFIESVMIVPIKRDGVAIAMLELIHSEPGKSFSEEDLKNATLFAEQLKTQLHL